jgi:hypothetical protein
MFASLHLDIALGIVVDHELLAIRAMDLIIGV